jgi:hypothetical protein
MASVTFRTLWLSPADDLAAGRSFRLHDMRPVLTIPGEYRRYANGRTRLIKRAGQLRQEEVLLKHLDQASVQQLESWAGELLLMRDPRGGRLWGSYLEVSPAPRPIGTADVTLTFVEVTHDEAV